jgi:type IV secretion system protein TrbL
VIASIFSGLLNSALSGIASSFAQAANSFLSVLFRLLNTSTSLTLGGASFLTEFDAVFMIGLLLALALAMIELAAAALQRNGSRVAKVPLNLVLMVVGTVASISLLDMLLMISDQLSAGLLQATGFSLSMTGMTAAMAVVATQPGTELMLSVFIIIAVVCCYFALVVRRVLIVVAAVMAPLALAGATAQITRSWVRRWSETILALVFSKVILVIVLITGFHLLQGAGATNIASAMASLIGGVGLLFIAAFSPLMAMKMVSFTGGHFAEAASLGHQAVSAAAAPVKKVAHVGTAALSGGASAAAGAAFGVRLPGAGTRASARQGITPSAPSPRSERTASASGPSDVVTTAGRASGGERSAHATSEVSPTVASMTNATPNHAPTPPSRTGAMPSANSAHATTQPPSTSTSSTSAAPEVRHGTVDATVAANPLAADGVKPLSNANPASPVEKPSAPRANAERPSRPTPRPHPSAPAPFERPTPPISEAL